MLARINQLKRANERKPLSIGGITQPAKNETSPSKVPSMKKNLRATQRNVSKLASQGNEIGDTGSKASPVAQPYAFKSF